MRRTRGGSAVMVGLAAGALVLAGCGGSSSGDSSGAQGGSLVVLTPTVAQQINPDGATASAVSTLEAIDNAYDTLIYYEPKSTTDGVIVPDYTKFAPRLATSWSSDDGGKTWVFKLRPDVKSCAGNPFTANDVVYTWARAKSLGGGPASVGWFLGNVGGLFTAAPIAPGATAADKKLGDEVKAIDTNTVQFTLQKPNPLFPRVLAVGYTGVFDSVEMKAQATADDPWSAKFTDTKGAAGFGAYCVKNWVPGQTITYTANSGSYLKPSYTTVVNKAVPQNANRVAAVQSGSAQIVTGLTPVESESVSSSGKADVLGWQSNQNVILSMNYKIDPWGLPKNQFLRQAIAYAMPYEDMKTDVFKGKAEQMLGDIPPGYAGYKSEDQYKTDLDKAKSLLAQAGYPGGAGLDKYASGLQLTYPSASSATLQPTAQLIQSSLAKIGVNITLNPITTAEFATRVLTKRDLPFAMDDNEHPIGPDAGYTMQLYFQSADKGGISNESNYSSASFDALVAKQASLPAGAERDQVLGQAQDQLMTDMPWVPLLIVRSEIAVSKGINNWLGNPDTTLNYWTFKK